MSSEEPDEAHIAWGACAAARYDDEENGNPLGLPQGMPNFEDFRDGYRAGAAAFADREEKLKVALADTLSGLEYIREFHGPLYGVGWGRFEPYRALLKEADQ